MKTGIIKTAALGGLVLAALAPTMAMADDYRDHRDNQRNTWKGLSIGSALIGLAGLASGNKDVAIAGAAGAVYSAYRANADSCGPRDRYYDGPVHYYGPAVTIRDDGRHDRDWDRNRDRDRDRDHDRGRDSDRNRHH